MTTTTVEVDELPRCEMCGATARYDAATKAGWSGYLCEPCFGLVGVGLGRGRGVRLVPREPEAAEVTTQPKVFVRDLAHDRVGEVVYWRTGGGAGISFTVGHVEWITWPELESGRYVVAGSTYIDTDTKEIGNP